MTMQRTILSLTVLSALVVGCDDDSPKEEISEAKTEHREAIREANEDLAEAYAEADEDMAKHEDRVVDGGKDDTVALQDRDRFEALKDESDPAFVARANARISEIEKDLDAVDAPAEARKDIRADLDEAREDLQEFKDDKLADDGKLGVTVALNSAERKLERVASN